MAGRAGTILVMVEVAGTQAAGTLLAWREEPAWKEARQKLPAFHLMAASTERRQKLLASHPAAAWMALPLVAAWRTMAAWTESRQMVPVGLYAAAA